MKDFAYHGLAALFFLSAGVDLAIITIGVKVKDLNLDLKIYRTYISAVVSTITPIELSKIFVQIYFYLIYLINQLI